MPFTPAEWGFMLLTALYVCGGWVLAHQYGLSEHYRPLFYIEAGAILTQFLLMLYIVGWCLWALGVMAYIRPRNLRKYLWSNLKNGPFNAQRYVRALPLFISFLFFFSAFTSLKFMIPGIQPFLWDSNFADIDKIIHGDTDPWKLLQPLIGFPYATLLINFIYNLWLPILYFILYAQLFSLKDLTLRMKFFYTFALSWILNGTILAIFFSSAGPCFYDLVVGSDRFMPLLEYLLSVSSWEEPIWAITTQLKLWSNYVSDDMGVGAGISAMPSIHVTTAFLFMLLGFKSSPIWKYVSIIYFLFIMVGAVHLGWHYAIDGYLSILTTWGVWVLVGKTMGRFKNT